MTNTFSELGIMLWLGFAAPFAAGKSITQYLKTAYLNMENSIFSRVFSQLFDAIQFLHNHGIIHRDLNPDNICVSDENLKVIDLGAAEKLPAGVDQVEAPRFGMDSAIMPPELAKCEEDEQPFLCERSQDIFELGILMLWCTVSQRPYQICEHELFLQFSSLLSHKLKENHLAAAVGAKTSLELPDEYEQLRDVAIKSLIAVCLVYDPAARPSINAVISQFESFLRERLFFDESAVLRARALMRLQRQQAEEVWQHEDDLFGCEMVYDQTP